VGRKKALQNAWKETVYREDARGREEDADLAGIDTGWRRRNQPLHKVDLGLLQQEFSTGSSAHADEALTC